MRALNPANQELRIAKANTDLVISLQKQVSNKLQLLGISDQTLATETNAEALNKTNVRLGEQIAANKRQLIATQRASNALSEIGNRADSVANIAKQQIAANLLKIQALEAANLPENIASQAALINSQKALTRQYRVNLAAQIRADGGTNLAATSARLGLTGGGGLPGGGGGGGSGGAGAGRGFFAGGALSSIKFGLPSIALFSGGRELIDSLKDAEELERLLLQLENQLQVTVGPENATKEFERLRDIIKETSREVGLAGSEVAGFAIQFQGAFGEGSGQEIDGQSGTDLVESQIFDASRFARMSGLDDAVVFDDFSAASLAFNETAESIANVALATQDSTGVAADEIINFLGKIAPVAKQAGFSIEEFAALAGTAQQASGASGDVLAEQYGRIIPAISGARIQLLELAQTNEALNQQPFLDALAQNETGNIIKILIQEYDNLGSAAQNAVTELIGSRREAGALVSVFENSGTFERTLGSLADTTGRLDERFEAFSGTFGQQLARLSQTFRQLLLALLDAGLADLFSLILESLIDVANVTRTLVEALAALASPLLPVVDLLREMNDLFAGFPAKIALVGVALKAVGLNVGLSTAASGLGSLVGLPGSSPRNPVNVPVLPVSPAPVPVKGFPAGGIGSRLPPPPVAPVAAPPGRLARIGASPVAAGLATAVAIVGVTQAYDAIREQQEVIGGATENLLTQLNDVSDEELQRLIDETPQAGRAVTAGLRLIGERDVRDVLIEIQNKRGFDATVDGIVGLLNTGGLDELVDGIKSTDNDVVSGMIERIESQGFTPDQINELNEGFRADIITFDGTNEAGGADNIGIDLEKFRDPRVVAELIAAAEAGSVAPAVLLEFLEGGLDDDPELRNAINELVNTRGPSFELATAALEASNATLAEANAAYESGSGSLSSLLDALDTNIAALQNLMENEGAEADEILAFAEGLASMQKNRSKLFADAAVSQLELSNKVIGLREGGSVSGQEQQLDGFLALLDDPDFDNPDARLKAALDVIAVMQGLAQASINATEDGFAAAALITAGVEVPDNVRVEILLSQLNQNNPAYTALTDAYVAAFGETADAFTNSIVTALVAADGATEESDALIQEQLVRVQAAISASTSLGPNAADGGAGLQILYDLRRALLDQIGKSISEFFDASVQDVGTVGADPIAGAAAAKKAADDAAKVAKQAADERARAAKELFDAQNAYALALVSGDPLKVAQENQRQAQEAVSRATTEAERITAAIRLLDADRSVEQAMRDIGDSQTDLLIAQANAAGRTVEAADLNAQAAAENLARVQADFLAGNAGEAAVRAAEIANVAAQANARDAQFSDQIDEYEYLNEIGAITTQQLIAFLQKMKTIPTNTEEMVRDLDRKIRSLSNEVGQDLQFNLPATISVPTLFESRRLNQSVDSNNVAAGYQDNRVVSIQLNVNGNTDAGELVELLDSYLGNNRSTVSVRRY